MNNKIKIIRSKKSWIESNAVQQLKKVSELPGIIKAVGLPDLHAGKTPVGASYMTKDIIYPHIIGNDIGCGIALFSTGIKRNKFKINKVMKKLEKINDTNSDFVDQVIKDKNINDMPFKEKLGTIGSGNHFAELQEINTAYDKAAIENIGIEKNNIFLLVHSGSRSYGEYILKKYIKDYSCQSGIPNYSNGFNEYLRDHQKAIEFANLNRELIANKILTVLNSKSNRKLLDSIHNSISIKKCNGETYYIHRKGAAPSDIGYVVIAGSRGSKSYIVEPMDNLFEYAFSVSHGAGRKWPRQGCKERLSKIYSKKSIRQNKISSNIIYKDKNLIYEEAPEAYKNIERVIEDMISEKMIKLVASLNPLITYKV